MARILRAFFCAFSLVLMIETCFSQGTIDSGQSDLETPKEAGEVYHVRISGVIRLVGNEPFTRLVITIDSGVDYIIENDYRKKYHDLQGSWVTATGTVRESKVFAGRDNLIGVERWFKPKRVEIMNH